MSRVFALSFFRLPPEAAGFFFGAAFRWDALFGPAGFRAAPLFAAAGFAAAFFRGPLVLDLPVSDVAFAMKLPGCFL